MEGVYKPIGVAGFCRPTLTAGSALPLTSRLEHFVMECSYEHLRSGVKEYFLSGVKVLSAEWGSNGGKGCHRRHSVQAHLGGPAEQAGRLQAALCIYHWERLRQRQGANHHRCGPASFLRCLRCLSPSKSTAQTRPFLEGMFICWSATCVPPNNVVGERARAHEREREICIYIYI